jgi:hypothetical protein
MENLRWTERMKLNDFKNVVGYFYDLMYYTVSI